MNPRAAVAVTLLVRQNLSHIHRLLLIVGALVVAGCVSSGPVTSRPAIQRQVGKEMALATRVVIVEGKDGARRLEELKMGLVSGDRVIAHLDAGEVVEVIGAIYRSRPLQLRYFLTVRVRKNGDAIVAETEIKRDGACILLEK